MIVDGFFNNIVLTTTHK